MRGDAHTVCHCVCTLGDFFFYFLVYGSSDPNFCILEKKKKITFYFFYFLRCKKLPDLKKIKLNIEKKITKIV